MGLSIATRVGLTGSHEPATAPYFKKKNWKRSSSKSLLMLMNSVVEKSEKSTETTTNMSIAGEGSSFILARGIVNAGNVPGYAINGTTSAKAVWKFNVVSAHFTDSFQYNFLTIFKSVCWCSMK